VIVVVFIFLQSWRATLIPLMTVPVSLVGAFIFFPLLGFSINVLSLLGPCSPSASSWTMRSWWSKP
jgi:HAE1 family hydrophobic/amphiphilic exporter-1